MIDEEPLQDTLLKVRKDLINKKLLDIWRDMRQRCYNPKNKYYHNYGGRGICICQEWLVFENFRVWSLANGYKTGLRPDRFPDINGNYNPGNVRWVVQAVDLQNRRSYGLTSKYKGVYLLPSGRWRAQITKDKKAHHLGCFDTEIDAAKAYDPAALKLWGIGAGLNFPTIPKE